MKLWELPGWNTGARVRRAGWYGTIQCNKEGTLLLVVDLHADDWMLVEEPKKKKTITLWRPIVKDAVGYRTRSGWMERERWADHHGDKIVAWESREVTVDE